MGKLKDLTGKRFGSLTVRARAGSNNHKKAMWLCDCDCGNKVVIVGSSLTSGNTTSCGCSRKNKVDYEAEKLMGQKFGRLTVISRAENRINQQGRTQIMLHCKCDCGNDVVVYKNSLINGHTKSCGCFKREVNSNTATKHGMSRTRIYKTWEDMIKRCYNKSSNNYYRYGGRGITVFDEWLEFENFYKYVSKLPHYNESGYSFDRIDNDGNYEPENVRWADNETQANNKSTNYYVTYNDKTQTIAQWSKETNIPTSTLRYRIRKGWDIENALTTPSQTRNKIAG